MLSLTWLMVIVLMAHAREIASCPKVCRCTSEVARCASLGTEKFPSSLTQLIIEPNSEVLDSATKAPLVIENDTFVSLGLPELTTLSIRNTEIKSLSPNAFNGLKYLQEITLDSCKLTQLHPDLFVNVSNLVRLNLNGNPLKGIKFSENMSLKELYLANCKIKPSRSMFKQLADLSYLNLATNGITDNDLNEDIFADLINLEVLDISDNEITYLKPNVFERNEDLTTLNVSYNFLSEFKPTTEIPTDKLLLKQNNISLIDSKFGEKFTQLSNLDLSDNEITTIEKGAFSKIVELQYIDLSGNSLTELLPDVFVENYQLESIILDDNQDLQKLPVFETKEPMSVYVFSCNNCDLTKLDPDTFAAMPSITILRLADNSIASVNKGVFMKLSELTNLDLSNNVITYIEDDAFSKNPNLVSVNLGGNPLKVISSNIFRSNRALKTLDISSCQLSNLWDRSNSPATVVQSLQTLKASDNNLTVITENDMALTPSLKVLDISKNNMQCTEQLRVLIEYLTKHNVKTAANAYTEKTHDSLTFDDEEDAEDLSIEQLVSAKDGWRELAEISCPKDSVIVLPDTTKKPENTFNDDLEYEDDGEDDDANSSYSDENYNLDITNNNQNVDDEDDDDDDYGTRDDDENINIEENRIPRKSMYSYKWPILVFIFTALLVLVIVANVIMLYLKHRGNIDLPGNPLPHIKIQPWGTGNKMKKHSGSVYRPLSEDISGPRTPMINRYAPIPTVHNHNLAASV